MGQKQQINWIWSPLKRGARAFFILLLFTFSIFVNQSEAGWFHTEGEDLAVKFIHTLQTGDLEKIGPYLDPAILAEDQREALTKAIDLFPKGAIKEITRTQINVNYNIGSEGKQEVLQFYVEMDGKAILIEEVLQHKDGQIVIQGFHFHEAPMNMMSQFPFTMIQWVQPKNIFLAVGVFNLVFIPAVLILMFLRPMKHKLLWLPVVFVGFTEASAQWLDDGPWSFTLMALKFPSIWFTEAAGQDPWSFLVSYPLGATIVLFLILISQPEEETATESVTMPTRRRVAMPRRTQVQPRQRPRPQPTEVGQ